MTKIDQKMISSSNDDYLIESIPLGAWDMLGNWYPNHNLTMSPDEQYEHNVKHDYIKIRSRSNAMQIR